MNALTRAAGYGALLIFLAFLMHNLNAWYIEPNFLGFEDPRTDYANAGKLRNAMGSVPWMLSGFGHFVSGFGAVALGLAASELFRSSRPVAGRLALGAGLLSGAGFMLTGIADMMGGQALGLLASQNESQMTAIYLAGSIMRIGFNGLAIVALGWFAVQLSWCGLTTRRLPKGFCYFGFVAGATGLVMAFAYIPLYLSVYPVYALWLALTFLRLPEAEPA